ncbi:FkbM family methyltransferase [Erythromicrobium ramosum]|uniref:FkbM family methyltransferase n=1 Tax=Erythrobacter ramosus TaxID=35811 RepID=A0A6I4UQ77_9SPHN|nr:FkbM family methyltransferase [Erythrobacter ramosus]MBB3777213.1 FkbM family methyltransferase [Erythrobacter ramosus]MXP39954.1 FkbM family methyltransferase [Erythrobacter ramosus]
MAIAAPEQHHLVNILRYGGDFEPEFMDLFCKLYAPGTTAIDVGANIGLYSASLLQRHSSARVISIECAPQTVPYIQKTVSLSEHRDRWQLVEQAVGDTPGGSVEFFAGTAQDGVFDGLRNTGRGGQKSGVKVPITTLDVIWEEAGRPSVSIIKIDIEGGETTAIAGAHNLIAAQHPYILMEWNADNLAAWDIKVETLLNFRELGYRVVAVPQFWEVDHSNLSIATKITEMYLLYPS